MPLNSIRNERSTQKKRRIGFADSEKNASYDTIEILSSDEECPAQSQLLRRIAKKYPSNQNHNTTNAKKHRSSITVIKSEPRNIPGRSQPESSQQNRCIFEYVSPCGQDENDEDPENEVHEAEMQKLARENELLKRQLDLARENALLKRQLEMFSQNAIGKYEI